MSLISTLAGAASMIVLVTAAATFRARRHVEDTGERDGAVWKRAYHLACELASGRSVDTNQRDLIDFLATTGDPMLASAAMAVAVRQHGDDINDALHVGVSKSVLPRVLRTRLTSESPAEQIEALEIIEVLRMSELLGDAAVLTRHADPGVSRAACDAVVEIEPAIGIGVLVGRVDDGETWVIEAIGRAADVLTRTGQAVVPLSRNQWRSAPVLARRAIMESATFDRLTVSDAINTLVGALGEESSSRRLAAVSALAVCADHPGAQLGLAGALGAPDRMTRFAAAASLSDSVAGQRILRRTAARNDGSDAAKMAAEILWSQDSADLEGPHRVAM